MPYQILRGRLLPGDKEIKKWEKTGIKGNFPKDMQIICQLINNQPVNSQHDTEVKFVSFKPEPEPKPKLEPKPKPEPKKKSSKRKRKR